MNMEQKEGAKTILVCLLNSTIPEYMHQERDRLLQEVADIYGIDFDTDRDLWQLEEKGI